LQSRPFGVAILFAGFDEKGPQLFHMDPSGTFVQFEAKAIGSGSEGAQQSLQEVYHKVQSKISHQHPFHNFWLSMSVVLGSVYYTYSYVV
jgi:20S proteasome alpha/beta subunit